MLKILMMNLTTKMKLSCQNVEEKLHSSEINKVDFFCMWILKKCFNVCQMSHIKRTTKFVRSVFCTVTREGHPAVSDP